MSASGAAFLLVEASHISAEGAVERKAARRVKPWLASASVLDVPEWQELAGDRLKSIKIRT
jgi:hypothetical protein